MAARFLIAIAVAALVAPATAGALTMKVERERSTEIVFFGSGCGTEDSYTLTAPAGGYTVRPVGLTEGDRIAAAEEDVDVATVRSVLPGSAGDRRTLTWNVVGSGASCGRRSPDCEYYEEDELYPEDEALCEPVPGSWPWETEAVDLRMSYLVRKRVPMFTLREMRSDARATLSARFGGAWDHGNFRRVSCRRISRYKGRCRFAWGIGDVSYEGSFVSTKTVRRRGWAQPDQVRIRNVGSALQTNEYCVYVTGGDCYDRIRIRY